MISRRNKYPNKTINISNKTSFDNSYYGLYDKVRRMNIEELI